MIVEGLAAVGVAAIAVSVIKAATDSTYEEAISTVSNSIKNATTSNQMFSLERISGFLSGLKDIIDSHSDIPYDLTTCFSGTTGTFYFYQFEVIPKKDSGLPIIEKLTYNLVYKTLISAQCKDFHIIVISDIQNPNTGYAIVTVYFAITSKQIKALKDWQSKQINIKKAALVPGPVIDDDLEKDLKDNGC